MMHSKRAPRGRSPKTLKSRLLPRRGRSLVRDNHILRRRQSDDPRQLGIIIQIRRSEIFFQRLSSQSQIAHCTGSFPCRTIKFAVHFEIHGPRHTSPQCGGLFCGRKDIFFTSVENFLKQNRTVRRTHPNPSRSDSHQDKLWGVILHNLRHGQFVLNRRSHCHSRRKLRREDADVVWVQLRYRRIPNHQHRHIERLRAIQPIQSVRRCKDTCATCCHLCVVAACISRDWRTSRAIKRVQIAQNHRRLLDRSKCNSLNFVQNGPTAITNSCDQRDQHQRRPDSAHLDTRQKRFLNRREWRVR
mmetsp:Transcript_26991/g.48973  ORF Transcript_26991/g.48973 Transcript_26991/m.48973 type:complete len:301 (-) Transcript_26991:1857-2759(-)